jgi:hypothetical protein
MYRRLDAREELTGLFRTNDAPDDPQAIDRGESTPVG